MSELVVGLAANRTSYFDQLTNTYITLDKPVQKIKYNAKDMDKEVERLKNIVSAILGSNPALRLYKGELPKESIEHWEEKYKTVFNTDVTRLMRNLKGDIVAPKANGALDRSKKAKTKKESEASVATMKLTKEEEKKKVDAEAKKKAEAEAKKKKEEEAKKKKEAEAKKKAEAEAKKKKEAEAKKKAEAEAKKKKETEAKKKEEETKKTTKK